MRAEPSIEIVGPEGTPLRFPLASPAERFAAFTFDLAVLLVVFVLAILAVVSTLAIGATVSVAFGIVLLFAIRHGYFLFFETLLSGATPGKRINRLRVISRDGGRLRLEALLARNLMRDLETFVPLTVALSPESLVGPAPWWLRALAGLWAFVIGAMPLYTRERLRSGDLLGGTVVVRIPSGVLVRDESANAEGGLAFSRTQLSVYGEHELETLAELLRRHAALETSTEDLVLVARTIATRIGFEGSEPADDAARFLRSFYGAQRAELERRLVLGRRKAHKRDGESGTDLR